MNLYKSQDDYTAREWRGYNLAERRRDAQVTERAAAILKSVTEIAGMLEEHPTEIAQHLMEICGENYEDAVLSTRAYLRRLAQTQAEDETPYVDYEKVLDELRGNDES